MLQIPFWQSRFGVQKIYTSSQGILEHQGSRICDRFDVSTPETWGGWSRVLLFFLQKKWMGFFSHTNVAGEGRLLLFFFCASKTRKAQDLASIIWSVWESQGESQELRQVKKKGPPTWRIIPVSKWLVTPIYKPFSQFGRGIPLLRGPTNHGY